MNIQKMFETQAKLDDRIVKEKGLQGQDLLDKKILALQVELGELAQEWRGFKFWSGYQEPRTLIEHLCPTCDSTGYDKITPDHYDRMTPCTECNGKGKLGETNPLLEEYVDCLHFILSIGNDLGIKLDNASPIYGLDSTTDFFIELISTAGNFDSGSEFVNDRYEIFLGLFLVLGKRLGFTWKQIEIEYYHKNKINHERQDNGY